MSNFDPAFAGYCSCGRPCYGQSTCTMCDDAAETESRDEEEKVLCCCCEDEEVKDKGDMCSICKADEEEAQADMWRDDRLLEQQREVDK